ncbi:MAG: PAS domain S-box protein [Deltaproteobacteria bacterium]|nr:PAS domain S-box protein [Deltaproteobacteria bacterium]
MSGDERIFLAGGHEAARASLAEQLRASGFGNVVGSGEIPLRDVADIILLVGSDAPHACSLIRRTPGLGSVPVMALVPRDPPSLATAALKAGADDALQLPVHAALLVHRVRAHLRTRKDWENLRAADLCEQAVLDVLGAATEDGDPSAVIREILFRSLDIMEFERASVVLEAELTNQGHVIGATDDPTLSKFTVSLDVYPELRAAIAGNRLLFIPDLAAYPPLADKAASLAQEGVRSATIFPLTWRGRACGAVFFRSSKARTRPLGPRQVAFGRIVAGIISQRISGGQVIENIKEQTHRVSLRKHEMERRLKAIDQLKDYFEASADGIVAVDGDGHVLFVNRAAEAATGFAKSGLLARPLVELVSPGHREGLESVIQRVLEGTNLEPFDLDIATTSGEQICVSVATSTILSEHGAAILSFRDVTAQRALERELRKTTEFLEKLIDSTVDAIVAADIRGKIILFNRGAERIYGWKAEELVGQESVEKLYPEGGARQVMRMLRSTAYGGPGRLEVTRRDIVTKDGECVPVNMTASIIYQEDREVATVGIFSDLRERLRIEQRLKQAQEKLLLTEKQALVAELAGAAAHELNQPLTSVMGYAELLTKKMQADDPHFRAVDIILSEAARMAEIVKKIGRITKYETKAYVGSAQILDLEKSSDHLAESHETPGSTGCPSGSAQ